MSFLLTFETHSSFVYTLYIVSSHKLWYMLLGIDFVFFYFYFVYAEYWVVLVGRIFSHSVCPYDDGYLLQRQYKL